MSSDGPGDGPLGLAEQAHALVQADPRAGLASAEQALVVARRERDREAEVAALHALGFARYALGDGRALATMREAVRVGRRGGQHRRAALARRNLAVYLAYAGKATAARREIDAARAVLTGLDRARTEVFRIAVLGATGVGPADLDESAPALRALRRAHDRIWEARLLYNRGALCSDLGEVGRARSDLEAARAIYADLGADAAVADAEIKLARLRLLDGDPIGCLAELDRVAVATLSDWAACWLYLSRAEASVALRLLDEARADLARFVNTSAAAGALDSLTKARLDAARLALLAGDPESATSLAAGARRSFAARRQPTDWARAVLMALAAELARGGVRSATLRAALDATAVLAERGHGDDALRGHQLVARAAAGLGRVGLARREAALAAPLRRRGAVADRVESWRVEGALRLAEGDTSGAERALRTGLRLLEDYRAALGALEVRVSASAIGADLALTGVGLALGGQKAAPVLAWAERLRANTLRLTPVRPEADPRLRAAQAELRSVEARLRAANERGRHARSLITRRAELESAIRARTRHARGEDAATLGTVSPRDATHALGGRVLVEYVEHDGGLHAVTLADGRLALHDLGRAADAVAELDWLRFALARLARHGSSRRRNHLEGAETAAAALDRLVVEPLSLAQAPLVVVPTGALHALPWGALPSLRGRPVAVAPSLSLWVDLDGRPRPRRRKTTLVAGPRLRHAAGEIRDLGALYPDATALVGAGATAAATAAALDGATLAHVACHGRLRADSPLFSALELADSPLTALDVQQLRRAPDVLVLSACDLALSELHAGDELLGFAAALLGMGTRTIVASVVPVPDAAARRLMLAFHRELAAGASPSLALARAPAALGGGAAALQGFVCLGAG